MGPTGLGGKGLVTGLASRWAGVICPNTKMFCGSGLSSGEGLISFVADEYYEIVPGRLKSKKVKRPEAKRRVIIIEEEAAGTFRAINRPGNILSPIVRKSWDGRNLQIMNKNSPLQATNARISILIGITPEELKREMTSTEIANGFANRFLPIFTKRVEPRPYGGSVNDARFSKVIGALKKNIETSFEFAKKQPEMSFSLDAKKLWEELYYTEFKRERHFMMAALSSRLSPMILRISVILASFDGSQCIEVSHLLSAAALCRNGERIWSEVYGQSTGDRIADGILECLHSDPKPKSKSDLSNWFQRNQDKENIDRALALLFKSQIIEIKTILGAGRPKTLYRLKRRDLKGVGKNPKITKKLEEVSNSDNSLNSSVRNEVEQERTTQ